MRDQLAVGKGDEVEHAATEKRVGQLLFGVGRDHHHRPFARHHLVAGLADGEAHAVELVQKIVRELEVGFVDLVDEQHHPLGRGECFSERAKADVVANIAHVPVAEARIVEALHGVVEVEAVLSAGGRLHRPVDEAHVQRGGDRLGELGLAGAGFAAHQQRSLERQRAVDRGLEAARSEVAIGALESLKVAHRARTLARRSDGKTSPKRHRADREITSPR